MQETRSAAISPVLLSSVYVMLSCTFKYGRQDMDVMGVAFRRDLFVVTRQVYPELQDKEQLIHTKVQRRLVQKLGDNAIPFFFEVRRCWWEPDRALDRNLLLSLSFQTICHVRWLCSLDLLMRGR